MSIHMSNCSKWRLNMDGNWQILWHIDKILRSKLCISLHTPGLAWLGLVFQIHPYPFRSTQIQPDLFRSIQITQIHPDPPIFAPHPPRSIQIHPDLFRSTQIHTDPTRTTKIHPDPPSYTQIQPDPPRSIQIHQDPPRSFQIHPDPTNSLTNEVPN